jgi:nitrous oxide reductase accessory protein NosL
MTLDGMRLDGTRLGGMRFSGTVGALAALLLLLPLGLAACGPAPDPMAPPEIVYGEDVCDACGMIISEERFAAAAIVSGADGPTARKFDDIGDMLDYHARNPEVEILRWYVHDHDSLKWLDAMTASFVRSQQLGTPMGSGIAAFADAAAAEAKAQELGTEVLGFDALLSE